MKNDNSMLGTAGKKAREGPLLVTSDCSDFALGMGRVGKAVKLWWPENIESLLSSDDFVYPANPTGQTEQANKDGQ